MRIDDDDRKLGRDDRMDLIRRYQEEQVKLDQGGKVDGAKVDLQTLNQVNEMDASKIAENRGDIQAIELSQQLERTDAQHQADGTSCTSEAIDAAHEQQSRGESWQKFEARNQTEIPQSVEEKARADKEELEKEGVERQEKDRQSVRELQNEMAVRQRRIRS